MARVIAHAALLLDEPRDPLGSPQRRGVAQRFGPPLQRALDPLRVGGRERGFAPGAPRMLERRARPAPPGWPSESPTVDGTPSSRAMSACAVSWRNRVEPSRFERREIPFPAGRDVPCARDTDRDHLLSLCYEEFNKRGGIPHPWRN